MFCLYVCLCTLCVPDACGGQKKVSDLLDLELQMIVSCHVGAESRSSAGAARVLFFFLRFTYLFYVCEYTVAIQMVVSLHVVVGN